MTIEKTLLDLGLTKNNVKTYLALLKLKTASITEIAHQSGIPRPVVYASIEALSNLGLITQSLQGKRRFWSVEHPRNLSSLLEVKKFQLDAILPELNKEFEDGYLKPKIKYYSGSSGLNAVLEEILASGAKTIDSMGPSTIAENNKRRLQKFWHDRVKKKIHVRKLTSAADAKSFRKNALYTEIQNIRNLREMRVAPGGFTFDMFVMIIPETVYYLAPKKEGKYILSIRSDSHHAMTQSMFETIWQLATPLYQSQNSEKAETEAATQ